MFHLENGQVKPRHQRVYAPSQLRVLRGPKNDFTKGSRWVVGDDYGYAEILYMIDSKAIHPDTLYIEHIAIKQENRGAGYGRILYLKTEEFARNIGAKWVQLDSESEAVEFWLKMGFETLNVVFYKDKTVMLKSL